MTDGSERRTGDGSHCGPSRCTGSCWPPARSRTNRTTRQTSQLRQLRHEPAVPLQSSDWQHRGRGVRADRRCSAAQLAGQFAPQLAGSGFVTWTFAQVGLVSSSGWPRLPRVVIGRAFLRGSGDVAIATNEDVYGSTLFAVAGLSLLLFIAGAVMLGMAARRTPTLPNWAGVMFAASAVVFVLAFLFIDVVQPVAGLGIAAAGIGLGAETRKAAAEHLRPVDRRG